MRPPTAQKITISIDGTMPTKDGDMKPTCRVNIAPPIAANAAAKQNTKILKSATDVAGEAHPVFLVAHRYQDAAQLAAADELREQDSRRSAGRRIDEV